MTDVAGQGLGDERHIPPAEAPRSVLTGLVILVVVVTALYVGRDVLVPLALAILLSFVLAPMVRAMQRFGLGRSVPVGLAVFVAFGVIISVSAIMAIQLSDLAESLPRFQETIVGKVREIKGTFTGVGFVERLGEVFRRVGQEFSAGAPITLDRPQQVEVRQPAAGPIEMIGQFVSPLLGPLGTIGLVLLFSVFILLQREDLRNRLIRLAGSQDLQRTTLAIDDAARRLSRLFLMQLLLNAAYGVIVAVGLWAIGVPGAVLFGILAGILRFVPYIGAVTGALLPIALALAVEPGWTMAWQTFLFFIIVEPIVGHVIEPLVFGRSTGMSPVAVVIAATFWTWLWGPIGLLLATPLTVCLVVMGRHIDQLEFLEVMLGDKPPLTPPQSLYQRLLAGDPDEAAAQADAYLEKHTFVMYADRVAVPGLLLAQRDADRGALDAFRLRRIRDTMARCVRDLDVTNDRSVNTGPQILLAGGRSLLDEAAMLMVAELLRQHDRQVRVLPLDQTGPSLEETTDAADPKALVLGFLNGDRADVQIRYRARRIRRRYPNVPIVLCVLGTDDTVAMTGWRDSTKAVRLATSVGEALRSALELSDPPPRDSTADTQTPEKASGSGIQPAAVPALSLS
jgi:predicted PurR-regulated permease PerM